MCVHLIQQSKMRATNYFINTSKEHPSDTEAISHKLMLRAGLIKQLSGGIYSYLPLALRIIRKIEAIVREEMNAIQSVELLMPTVQPAILWKKTKRWEKFGPELLRLTDRHQRDFLISPTHEEVVTDLVSHYCKSYRQLPLILFQIQTKFRDEIRPRFGLIRSREFIMKDAYSFDLDKKGMDISYQNMFNAYMRIFSRMALNVKAVDADTGSIGGTGSTEFHVITQTGEDIIVYCPTSSYVANIEIAKAASLLQTRTPPTESLKKISTHNYTTCLDVSQYLGIPITKIVKSIVIKNTINNAMVILLLRGDHNLNETKVNKIVGLEHWQFAKDHEILETFGAPPGYLGPINTKSPVKIIADQTVAKMSDFVCGANICGFHFIGVNWIRDIPEPTVADIRNVVSGDPSPDGHGFLQICHGIEVGHIFKLGEVYSKPLSAQYIDQKQKLQNIQMGCYGIGISRLLSATIEQNHDEQGIIWPTTIAPFELVICPIGYDKQDNVYQIVENLYKKFLQEKIDVIVDDRPIRPGVMFADWDLIGVPHQIFIGKNTLSTEQVEYKCRKKNKKIKLSIHEVVQQLCHLIRQEREAAFSHKPLNFSKHNEVI